MDPGEDSDWKSLAFRQKAVEQIEEAMGKAGTAHNTSSSDMENHIFMKAKSKEEYLSLVARLIIHFREILYSLLPNSNAVMDPGADSDWRSLAFRQKAVDQIEEALRKAGTAHITSSSDMENHIFMKAKSKDEYLSLVARLIIYFRDIRLQVRPAALRVRAAAVCLSGVLEGLLWPWGLADLVQLPILCHRPPIHINPTPGCRSTTCRETVQVVR
ncbi:MED15 polymerase, partial [Polyodon spathula]|nr:MED15 polymerase [Polyodon spathula]